MSLILKVDPINPSAEILKKAAEVIKRGGTVAFPTETVYGLGANCFDRAAVLRVFEIKRRPADNPLIVHISNLKQLDLLIEDDINKAKTLIETFWPGPVTIIFKKKPQVPKEVTGGLETVAVRMPSHPVAKMLIELSDTPIAAPSANLSGRPSPTSAQHVIEDLYGSVDVIIDAGETPLGLESTVIDLSRERPTLLRPGPATVEEIRRVVPELHIPDFLLGKAQVERPLAPGMMYRHYAPNKPLILVLDERKLDSVLMMHPDAPIVCPEEMAGNFYGRRIIVMGKLSEPYTIAQNLFKVLRSVDNYAADVAIVVGLPEKGILFSVMNRLRKAASQVVE
ncbi:L-threonylcarbamoyladenylate synthase [Thermotoga caldifontis]|uniref:L-threonylcarbamoyladenylate synthase n=1 Tax=Thermotoga caldifontis TaxID=1508419 RepID=UPI000596EAD1|nr:L-threonylcarbamoyladenylate synthase [Thermotoga caldifontis]